MRKLYKLTPSQMLHQRWIEEYGTQQVAGLSAMAVLKTGIDMALLEKAVNDELRRQKCLCFRFTRDKKSGEVNQYFVAHEDEEFEILDLTQHSYEEAQGILQKMSYELLPVYDQKCYDIKLLIMPDGYSGVFIHADHRLMDGYAMAQTFKDIVAIYCSYKFEAPYPELLFDYEEMLKKDLNRIENARRQSAAEDYWKEQLNQLGEPMYSDIRGKSVLEAARKKHGNPMLRAADIEEKDLMVQVQNYKLEAEPASRLFAFCQDNNVNMTNLLLLGIRTYLSKVNDGQEDICLEHFISRRASKAQWTSGGCRTIMFPCRSKISPSCDFRKAAEIIKGIQNKVYYHNYFDPARIEEEIRSKYATPERSSYESCYLTYQPTPQGFENPLLKDVDIKYKWFSNGAATKKMYLTVSQEKDGGLNFSFHYQRACLCLKDIELLYYYLMRILFKGIEKPDISLGELMATV